LTERGGKRRPDSLKTGLIFVPDASGSKWVYFPLGPVINVDNAIRLSLPNQAVSRNLLHHPAEALVFDEGPYFLRV